MAIKEVVLDILVDLTGTDEVKKNENLDLFATGLLDSLGMVQLLVEVEGQLGISVPVSEVERENWNTPGKIIAEVEALG